MTPRILPVPFSPPMVRALLAGTKTQTRRALSEQPGGAVGASGGCYHRPDGRFIWTLCGGVGVGEPFFLRYRPGDILYVREPWRVSKNYDDHAPVSSKSGKPTLKPRGMTVLFEAGGSIANQQGGGWLPDIDYPGGDTPAWAGKFRQGMHLPRWASRLTLAVSEVRVERLQDCSEEDAIAEGVEVLGAFPVASGKAYKDYLRPGGLDPWAYGTAVESYCSLWESINGPGSWDRNPWVAAYSFSVEIGNVDVLRSAA